MAESFDNLVERVDLLDKRLGKMGEKVDSEVGRIADLLLNVSGILENQTKAVRALSDQVLYLRERVRLLEDRVINDLSGK